MQIDVAGERVELLADRAVLWVRGQGWAGGRAGAGPGAGFARTVLVADVHLGKADTFRHFGLPLPDGDLDADLARLTALVHANAADRLLILGDLVHAAAGLNEDVVERVARWRAGLDCAVALVPGNHDHSALGAHSPRRRARSSPGSGVPAGSAVSVGAGQPAAATLPAPPALPAEWGIELLADGHREGPFRFAHHPAPDAGGFTWCGHLHPAAVVGSGRLADRFPCFWIGATTGVLPAFGSFTGGRSVRPQAGDRLVAVTTEGLVDLAAGAG